MKRKILNLVVVLSMLISCIPIAVSAETKYGDYLYYEINKDNTAVTITDYDETATEVEIPSKINGLPVTTIGEFAFEFCYSLTSIIIIKETQIC